VLVGPHDVSFAFDTHSAVSALDAEVSMVRFNHGARAARKSSRPALRA
jgi:hypothetical protein